MNRKQKRNKKANKIAKWIVDSILKLDDENLIAFYEMIDSELKKRSLDYRGWH